MDKIEQKADVVQYNPTIDVMNIAACIAVVALHVNGGIWGFTRNLNWAMMLVTECVCYWAVPVFFMITGATLLDYRLRYSTKVFFQKRFTKTGIPFIFWSIVSIFWAVHISHYLPPDVLSNLGNFLDAIVNTKGMSIYWFFPPLFALYLVIPVFSQISEDKRKNTFLYGSAIAFIICSCLPLLLSFLKISFNMPVIGGGGYCEYLFLGYYVAHYNIPKKIRTHMIYPLGAFGLLLRYVGTLVESFHRNFQRIRTLSLRCIFSRRFCMVLVPRLVILKQRKEKAFPESGVRRKLWCLSNAFLHFAIFCGYTST